MGPPPNKRKSQEEQWGAERFKRMNFFLEGKEEGISGIPEPSQDHMGPVPSELEPVVVHLGATTQPRIGPVKHLSPLRARQGLRVRGGGSRQDRTGQG